MFSRTLLIALVIGLVGFVLTAPSLMAEDEVTVTGTVKACGADCKAGCPGTLNAGDVTYKIADNEIGKKLVKAHDGQKVEVKGTVAEKDGAKSLTVKSVKKAE